MINMNNQERREFIKTSLQGLGITICAGSIMSILSSCEMNEDPIQPQETTFPLIIAIDDPNNSELTRIGGAMYYNHPSLNNGEDFIIIRVDNDSFLALSSFCTHQGCQVNIPSMDKPTIFCPCHFAEFSPLTGEVIKQPNQGTATNLPIFKTEFNAVDNRLTVYLPGND
jgi:Rieske Fe-S protein